MVRSFVYFERLSEKKPDIPGRDYLVVDCTAQSYDIAIAPKYCICKYYKKGETISLPYRPECVPEEQKVDTNATPEQRLLSMIFGLSKPFKIPKSGFYKLVAPNEVAEYTDDDSYVQTDCFESIVPLAENIEEEKYIFWAELPFAPDGYNHPYDMQAEFDRRMKSAQNRIDEEYIERLEDFINNDMTFENLELKDLMSEYFDLKRNDDNVTCIGSGLVVKQSYKSFLESVITVRLIQICLEFADSKMTDIEDHMSDIKYLDNIVRSIFDECPEFVKLKSVHGASKILGMVIFFVEMVYIKNLFIERTLSYFIHISKCRSFDRFYHENEKVIYNEYAARIVFGNMLRRLHNRLYRYDTLAELGAPAIILGNELRMAADIISIVFADIEGVITKESAEEFFGTNEAMHGGCYDFGSIYGIDVDGNRAEYDPPVLSGPSLEDENGFNTVPYIAVSKNSGEEVRYNAMKHQWDPDSDIFCSYDYDNEAEYEEDAIIIDENDIYEIKSYRKYASDWMPEPEFDKDNMKVYVIPDVGRNKNNEQVKFDARVHSWMPGKHEFIEIDPEYGCLNEDPDKKYEIISYRNVMLK